VTDYGLDDKIQFPEEMGFFLPHHAKIVATGLPLTGQSGREVRLITHVNRMLSLRICGTPVNLYGMALRHKRQFYLF